VGVVVVVKRSVVGGRNRLISSHLVLASIRLPSKTKNKGKLWTPESAPTPACRQRRLCCPDIKKPLVMTLVTRLICCQISEKVLIEN
jgi:hypothetical protein